MILDDRDIEELKAAHQEEFQETLSDKEAREMGARLMRLYELLIQPLPSERLQDIKSKSDTTRDQKHKT